MLPSGDLPDPRIEPTSFMSPALAGGGGFFTTSNYANFLQQMRPQAKINGLVLNHS